jgi:hypothetical protein
MQIDMMNCIRSAELSNECWSEQIVKNADDRTITDNVFVSDPVIIALASTVLRHAACLGGTGPGPAKAVSLGKSTR